MLVTRQCQLGRCEPKTHVHEHQLVDIGPGTAPRALTPTETEWAFAHDFHSRGLDPLGASDELHLDERGLALAARGNLLL